MTGRCSANELYFPPPHAAFQFLHLAYLIYTSSGSSMLSNRQGLLKGWFLFSHTYTKTPFSYVKLKLPEPAIPIQESLVWQYNWEWVGKLLLLGTMFTVPTCPRIVTKGATATSTLALNHLKSKEDCYSLHLLTRMCPIHEEWRLKGDTQRCEVSPWQREATGAWSGRNGAVSPKGHRKPASFSLRSLQLSHQITTTASLAGVLDTAECDPWTSSISTS